MFKKILPLLAIAIFIFWAGSVLAVGVPSNLDPCGGTGGDPEPLAVTLDWTIVGIVDHYELYYKEESATNWNDTYPTASEYNLTGLSPSPFLPDNKIVYWWYVVACENADCSISQPSPPCSFYTIEISAPPEPPPTDPPGGPGPGGVVINPLNATSLEEAINSIINLLFYLAIFISPLFVIYAAYLMLSAGGNPEKINKGKTIIFWTAIAISIIVFAKGLPQAVKDILG